MIRHRFVFYLALALSVVAVVACGSETDAEEGDGAAEVAVEAGEPLPLENEDQKTLYALGVVMANQMQPFNLTESELAYVQMGLRDTVLGEEPQVSMQEYGQRVQQLAQTRMQEASAQEAEAATAFIAEQAAEEGAVQTDSGLVYFSLEEGSGAQPAASDTVQVHYKGMLRDGTTFDSSYDRGQPARLPLTGVIPCWTEGIQMMKVGGKAKLVCPPDIGHGPQGAPPRIPGNAALVFEVELIDIVTEEGGDGAAAGGGTAGGG